MISHFFSHKRFSYLHPFFNSIIFLLIFFSFFETCPALDLFSFAMPSEDPQGVSELFLKNFSPYLYYEKYVEGWNELKGKEAVQLPKDHFQIGKVKSIHFFPPNETETELFFSYEVGKMTVWNDLDQMAVYYYSVDTGLLHSVDYFQNGIKMTDESPNCFSKAFESEKNEQIINHEEGWLGINTVWEYASLLAYSCYQQLQSYAYQLKEKFYEELPIPEELSKDMKQIASSLFGETTCLLLGFYAQNTQVANYGTEELSDKVRITYINGILNTKETMIQSVKLISESHGNVNVHYVYRPTAGWTCDISQAILIKVGYHFGFQSFHAHLLVQMWRKLIAEMGGVGQGGMIIHYAHSIGGSETERARELLTPEEQKMIRVITFGSATIVRNIGFHSVTNIVSMNDGVSSIILDPIGHLRHYINSEHNVQLQENLFYLPYWPGWPVDHSFNGQTYGTILQEYGAQFISEFNSN